MQSIVDVWRRHRLLVTAFAVSAALALFFLTRLTVGIVYWTAHREEPIRPWMTVGYIGHSWRLDPRQIDAAAGLPAPLGHPLTLQEIADRRGVPVETIIAAVEQAVADLKAGDAGERTP